MYCAWFGVRGNYAAFGFDIDRFAVLRHALRALLQYPRFFNRKVDLFRFDILNLTAHRGSIDIQATQNVCRSGDANRTTGQFKVVIAAIDLDAETAFELLDVVIKRAAQAQQTRIVCWLQVISRVSMFKPFLLSVCRRKLNIHRPIRKLFTPQEKGASIAIKMGIKREKQGPPERQA